MKTFHNKTIYLSDIINYQNTNPKACELEILRSYDQSVMNLKAGMSKNYFITDLKEFKRSETKRKSKQ
jgi:hypothetical protein